MRVSEILKPPCLKCNLLTVLIHQSFPYLWIFLYTGQENVKKQVFCVFVFNISSANKPATAGRQYRMAESSTAMMCINRISKRRKRKGGGHFSHMLDSS